MTDHFPGALVIKTFGNKQRMLFARVRILCCHDSHRKYFWICWVSFI